MGKGTTHLKENAVEPVFKISRNGFLRKYMASEILHYHLMVKTSIFIDISFLSLKMAMIAIHSVLWQTKWTQVLPACALGLCLHLLFPACSTPISRTFLRWRRFVTWTTCYLCPKWVDLSIWLSTVISQQSANSSPCSNAHCVFDLPGSISQFLCHLLLSDP